MIDLSCPNCGRAGSIPRIDSQRSIVEEMSGTILASKGAAVPLPTDEGERVPTFELLTNALALLAGLPTLPSTSHDVRVG